MAGLTEMMGRKLSTFETADDVPSPRTTWATADAGSVDHARQSHSLRNLDRHAESAAGNRRRRRPSRQLIVDAMSCSAAADDALTPFDALVAVGQVREGPPGMGFVFVNKAVSRGVQATHVARPRPAHQWSYMERPRNGVSPPTHIVVALMSR
jgi:2-aminoethylphosphonate-pyruvate transaminase